MEHVKDILAEAIQALEEMEANKDIIKEQREEIGFLDAYQKGTAYAQSLLTAKLYWLDRKHRFAKRAFRAEVRQRRQAEGKVKRLEKVVKKLRGKE